VGQFSVKKFIEDTLVIALKKDGVDFEQLQDTITIENYSNDNYKIENLEFSNGEIVSLDGSSNSTTDKQIVLDNIEVTLQEDNTISGSLQIEGNTDGIQFTVESVLENSNLQIDELGNYTYTPNQDYNGIEQISVSVINKYGETSFATLTFIVEAVNDTPIAKEDTAEVIENGTLTIQSIEILSNDIDVDTNDILTITNVEAAENKGIASLIDGNVVFETGTAFDYLAEGESEVVILNYEMQDDKGASSSSTISVTVTGTNDAPIVNFPLEEITLTQELTKSGQIQASDIDNDVLTYTIVENAKHGEFKVDENGIWKYNVDSTYSGEDSVIVQIDDLNGGIVTKTLNFNVDNNVKNGDDRTNFLFGNNEKNILNGLGGDDFIFALWGDDMILGGEGNDIIFAAQGDDQIWGGKGDDILEGHTGNDTYIFNIGDGNDTIFEYKSRNSSDINRILFGENITAENIKFLKDNNNLIIKVSENDSIKIMNWYTNQDNISEIVFDDGTKLLNSEILEKVALEGTSRKDTLRGTNTEDNMYALEGDDRVYGYGGNDLLNGGKGDDYLRGGDGDDIYSFSLGDGNDTIVEEGSIFNWNNDNKNDTVQFDNTISATDILFTWDRNNLIINYSDNDSIKIDNQKRGYKDIENFKLSDGSYLTNDDVEILIQNMTSFATENDIDLTNRNEVKNNSELMNIVTNAWHHAS
jgi:VCBS repeat-containing protein